MDDQRIQKDTQPVMLELSDGTRLAGAFFLRRFEAHHEGRQKVGDLLNESMAFIPFKTDDGVVLLNVSELVLIRVPLETEADDLMRLGKKYTVQLRTTQGKDLQGDIYVNLPEESSRIKDYLNQPARFYTLFRPDAVVYLNRRFILTVQD
ncbi:MAG TPA: hypothetical protein VI702_07250 [Nitrospiria bacterium]